jgi:RNase H-fold protein (predicted Holliday junction resolvase)
MRSIILAIDVGRSKIGCTGYEYNGLGPAITVNGISHNIPLLAVIANTGNIRIHEVLTAIENCIDETLRLLRLHMSESSYQVVAIGFATSVMNLVAVDIYGEPVGEIATCSDACDREDVVTECQRLIE